MLRYASLAAMLNKREMPDGIGITFIRSASHEEFLSYKDLYLAAANMLAFLQEQGMRPKDELIFQVEDNKLFVISFWACILGGIIPVPLAVGHNDDHKEKLFNVWRILKNPYLLIPADNLIKLSAFAGSRSLAPVYSSMRGRMMDLTFGISFSGECEIFDANEDDIAFVQFSSGSTGSPKGVVLTNRNLIANMQAISNAAAYSSNDTMMSWMPLTHDMGLIGFHLNPLFSGMNQYLIPTDLFIRRPVLWLNKASEHKISILCSPNFGFGYVVKHCKQLAGYDLNLAHVRIIYNGAEPISERLCREFMDEFARFGLERHAMCPVYGLAEASLAVSISRMEDEVIAIGLDSSSVGLGDPIIIKDLLDKNAISFVNVGKPVDFCCVRISVDEAEAVSEGIVGNIQIKGDNVTAGYYNNEAETKRACNMEGWFKTGDLGFMKGGSLYITGRAKDLIIINGQNYYPHDIERLSEKVEGIELNKVAVAGFFNRDTLKEEAVAFVFHRSTLESFIPIAKALRELINSVFGIEMDRILPVSNMPRTTSGKLQRYKLAEQLENGVFRDIEHQIDQLSRRPVGALSTENTENANERRLIEIWRKVLKTEKVDINQNFFELGGNSLKAAEVSMLLWKEFQIDMPMETLYQKPTLRELGIEMGMPGSREYLAIPAIGSKDYYPVSSAQKRLYYLWDINKSSTAYNIPLAFRIKGEVDTEILESCIKQIIRRHDSLRMSFHLMGEPIFKVHSNNDFALKCLTGDRNELDRDLKALVQPFDLSVHPLFRIVLIRIADGESVLFMDFHHIISDGISIYHFLEELLQLYDGKELPGSGTPFADYACWERECRDGEKVKSEDAYWLRVFGDELPILNLPLDFRRPLTFNTEGAKIAFDFDRETSDRLRNLATLNGCSLHALFLTLYSVILSTYTGQDDIIIGIPVSGRTHPDLQRVQGMFVNNLAIRNTIKREESFTGFLSRTNDTVREAVNHQDFSFDNLVRKVGIKRDFGRNPLFDTMLIYQNMGDPTKGAGAFSISRYFFDPGIAKFDLSLEVFDSGETIQYYFEYATNLFCRSTIERLAGHWSNLVQKVLAAPDQGVSELSLLSDDEYSHFIREFNRTQSLYPKGKTIHRLFEEQAIRTPDNIALGYQECMVTYRELNDKANRLADLLKEKGLVRGGVTAILLRRRPELIVSILGVLKAGCCYLPIDPDLPAGRIDFYISNSQSKLIIGEEGTIGRLDNLRLPVEVVNVDEPDFLGSGASGIEYMSLPEELAYIIYTSGTTGNPKGVMVEHRSLVNYVSWAAKIYTEGETMAFPLHTSISFDLTVTSIFVPLITGGKIVIYEEDENKLAIQKVIEGNSVDIIKLTPSHLKIIRDNKAFAISQGSRVRKLIVGGEALETSLARDIWNKFDGQIGIFNEYGPTEATVGCMIQKYEKDLDLFNVPIGIPAANTAIYLLDRYLMPVLPGTDGEIYISGDSIARGYLFNEELTADKFMPDPFCPGQRMYKTGDIGRQLLDGVLVFIGRIDQQVKINGYRIEPGEVQSCLLGYPGVTEALVVPARDLNGQQTIYAYYKTGEAAPVEILQQAEITNYLATMLPYYMIPSKLIHVDHYPLTKNGKIDYEALPLPTQDSEPTQEEYPQNRIMQSLLETWRDVFGNKNINVRDNFISLGGDSIKAVQIASRLAGKGIAVRSKDILVYHTIEQISRAARITGIVNTCFQGILSGDRGLSPIECWFLSQRFSDPGYYNQSILLELNRPVAIKLLEQAFDRLIRHHDGLRTNYNAERGVLYYNNELLDRKFIIEVIDCGKEPYDVAEVCRSLKTSFILDGSFLLKAVLIKGEGQGDLLRVTLHHLLTDGISWRVLLEDLYAVYMGLERQAEIQLPLKTATVEDWLVNLNEYALSGRLQEEKSYWKAIDRLAFTLPQDFETEDWTAENREMIVNRLSRDKTDFLLKEAHSVYDTDIMILLNTALALTLRDWTGQDCLVIEQENHGRYPDNCDLSRTIGWFTAMYPVKLLATDVNLGSLIVAVKEQVRGVPDHGIGYGTGKYLGRPPADVERNMAAVRFNYLGEFGRELGNDLFRYNDLMPVSDIGGVNEMTAVLEWNVLVINGVLRVEILYSGKAYKETTIKRVMDSFFENLVQIIDHIRHESILQFKASNFEAANLNDQELNALFF